MQPVDRRQPNVVVLQVSRQFDLKVQVPETSGAADTPWRRVAAAIKRPKRTVVRALRDISFAAYAGETIGILGQNGSGKSTLLSIIAGLDEPTTGQVLATSQPVLLGVGAALQPELSGISNARLGLLAMGLTPDEVAAATADVTTIAGLGEAIYRPLRTYSSGMAARLSFAIATAGEPRILLLDEILATGDAASVERAEARMEEIRSQAGTVFIVSHAAKTIQETCTRALWLHDGEVIKDGPADETAEGYRWWAYNYAQGNLGTSRDILRKAFETRTGVEKSAREAKAFGGAIEPTTRKQGMK